MRALIINERGGARWAYGDALLGAECADCATVFDECDECRGTWHDEKRGCRADLDGCECPQEPDWSPDYGDRIERDRNGDFYWWA